MGVKCFCVCMLAMNLHADVSLPKNLFTQNRRLVKGSITTANAGELGNACFRTATGVSYAIDNGYRFSINKLSKRHGSIVFRNFPLISARESFKTVELKTHFKGHPSINGSTFIKGFPQSPKYFDHNKKYIQHLFGPPDYFIEHLKDKYEFIFSNKKKYVGLHLRTFVRSSDAKDIWCSKEIGKHYLLSRGTTPGYYSRAIGVFDKDSTFIVFTDNIQVAEEYLSKFDVNCIYLEDSTKEEDFYLISMMDNMILCESTFSVFAAYLNQNPDAVVTIPRKNTQSCVDVDTMNWIMLDRENDLLGMDEEFDRWGKVGRDAAVSK